MNLLRVAVASLLLPAGAQVQAADVSRMAPNVVRTQPAHSGASVPNVSKVPAAPGPVPLPYPNAVPGAATVKDRAPVTTVIKRDQVPIKSGTGNEPGTLKEAAKIPGGPQAGGLRLTPLDDPRPGKADQSSDDSRLVQRELQERTSRESSNAQSLSNIMKQKSDTAKSVIQNIK